MSMVADVVDAVIGGDTHRDAHALQMRSPAGAVIAATTVGNDAAGFVAASSWIATHLPGPRLLVGLEGTRSYGIGLARSLQAAGLPVVEVERPRRQQRRRGKSDPIDAGLAALAVLQMDQSRLPSPRSDGDREALRILLGARHELTETSTRQINRLRALLLTGDDADRRLARGRLDDAKLVGLIRRRGQLNQTPEITIRRLELRRLATAIRQARSQLADNKRALRDLVQSVAPRLLDATGVGPVSAAQAIVSWSHHGRCRNEAAFAALAGACPIPASSGLITRHRLNRGGDRQLNAALHRIVLTRWRTCPRTKTYIETRRAQGKTDREIRRSLKRYVARQIYRKLQTEPLDNT